MLSVVAPIVELLKSIVKVRITKNLMSDNLAHLKTFLLKKYKPQAGYSLKPLIYGSEDQFYIFIGYRVHS
jgi:hypothetical protein